MGLRGGENLFVSDAGDFRPEAYIPAYVRRYPFVFANDDAQTAPDPVHRPRRALHRRRRRRRRCSTTASRRDYTEQAMEFCNNFEPERQRTDSFVKLLTDLDLFDTREAVFTPRNPDGTAGAAAEDRRLLRRLGREAEGPAGREAGRAARQRRPGPDLRPPGVAARLGPADRPGLPARRRAAGGRQRLKPGIRTRA